MGIIYFFGNSSYAAVLGLIANLVFTIFLTPAEYGLYFIVLSLIAIFNYFTDLGLAAALIQKKDPQEEEFQTAFTIQLGLVSFIIILGLLLIPLIQFYYHFDHSGVSLYLAMLFSLFLLSFKSVPSVRLERHLDYSKIVLTQAVESTLFYGTSILLMFFGFRIYALVGGILIRSVIGVFLIYYFTRWHPKLHFDKTIAKSILKFGIPFQSNVFLAFIKDDLLNLYLANRLGLAGIGYVGWAKKWAEAPLRIIMDNVNRVLFPVFSRFQDDREKIRTGVEKIIFYNSLILMPTLVGAYLIMPSFVNIVPKYQKWLIALPSFNFFLISSLLVSFASPLINIFNSMGRVKTSVKFMLLWIILNWTVVPFLVGIYGFMGVSLAFSLNALSFVFVWSRMRALVGADFLSSLKKPVISSLFMLLSVKISQSYVSGDLGKMIVSIGVGFAAYAFMILLLTRGSFVTEIVSAFKPQTNQKDN